MFPFPRKENHKHTPEECVLHLLAEKGPLSKKNIKEKLARDYTKDADKKRHTNEWHCSMNNAGDALKAAREAEPPHVDKKHKRGGDDVFNITQAGHIRLHEINPSHVIPAEKDAPPTLLAEPVVDAASPPDSSKREVIALTDDDMDTPRPRKNNFKPDPKEAMEMAVLCLLRGRTDITQALTQNELVAQLVDRGITLKATHGTCDIKLNWATFERRMGKVIGNHYEPSGHDKNLIKYKDWVKDFLSRTGKRADDIMEQEPLVSEHRSGGEPSFTISHTGQYKLAVYEKEYGKLSIAPQEVKKQPWEMPR